ncbi:uncharacterized protein EV420DRAFT_1633871 [Desarmillaria tabescens]|uniref:Apple domain-containing protein n=1 Tax=Armillaria tabescens TaxID=1929756 RepID=A0AA39T7B2_ARMTA|nr:uncharacterized protein EV420DRAFT_1633871 [Desarmillaria tabescens]KAK0469451.1 hypothetical protein EV420DRAFT_1633871 [Desarmillaria tabescens]
MRFSLAALIPLAVLVAPVLSGAVKAEHKGEHKDEHKGDKHSQCGFKCPQQWPDTESTWEPVFENKSDWSGWKSGKYTPVTTGYVSKDTFELDCKNICLAHEKCSSCQAFSLEEAAEEFICALFEEIIDISTWEDDCDDDKSGEKYYDTSCWNVQF